MLLKDEERTQVNKINNIFNTNFDNDFDNDFDNEKNC